MSEFIDTSIMSMSFFKNKHLPKKQGFTRTSTLCSTSATKSVVRKKTHQSGHSKSAAMLVCGFTLVELLVVIFIFTVMTSITVIRYHGFDNTVELNNQALEIALAIREAQTNAIGSKDSSVDSTTFKNAYGIFFSKNIDGTSFVSYINKKVWDGVSGEVDTENPTKYWFDDGNYSNCGGPAYECLRKYPLKSGYTISEICIPDSGLCSNDAQVSISFRRPDPAAIIRKDGNGSSGAGDQSSVKITIRSPKGIEASVHVTKTGLIYVK